MMNNFAIVSTHLDILILYYNYTIVHIKYLTKALTAPIHMMLNVIRAEMSLASKTMYRKLEESQNGMLTLVEANK